MRHQRGIAGQSYWDKHDLRAANSIQPLEISQCCELSVDVDARGRLDLQLHKEAADIWRWRRGRGGIGGNASGFRV